MVDFHHDFMKALLEELKHTYRDGKFVCRDRIGNNKGPEIIIYVLDEAVVQIQAHLDGVYVGGQYHGYDHIPWENPLLIEIIVEYSNATMDMTNYVTGI